MNQRERVLLGRLYACVNELGAAGPRNPADIGGIARHSALTRNVGRDLAMAISCLGYDDLPEAGEYLTDAELALGRDRTEGKQ